ncbi:hypothetical protein CSKR_202005 [Clonorchis sinensis]|uniref:Uncharacterized protein n=1 Tax=Clonorchis sinensis TaxID=79923 RepID=A0A8T1MYD5_CLOSI|nr:hypothetical protein CSKR_202005 [Clonorchis sinensis]
MRKAYDRIPGLQAVMPAEYSGYNETIEKLIEHNAKKFHQFYRNPSSWQGIQVDETKRPHSAKNLMSDFGDAERSCFGTEGTYVQLGPCD